MPEHLAPGRGRSRGRVEPGPAARAAARAARSPRQSGRGPPRPPRFEPAADPAPRVSDNRVGAVPRTRRRPISHRDPLPHERTHCIMDWRNRIGLYGSYFLGMAAIGFTLPYLPLYLGQKGLSDRAIGIVSTLAALAGLAQFPVGLWSDRIGTAQAVPGRRSGGRLPSRPCCSAGRMERSGSASWSSCSPRTASAARSSRASPGPRRRRWLAPGEVGAALGALRFWKPIGIVAVALAGSWMSEQYGVGAILVPLAVVQGLAVVAAS